MSTLKTGSHYWYRQRYEGIWRICYVGEDPDNQQWMWCTGITNPLKVADMELEFFEFQEIHKPKDEETLKAERKAKREATKQRKLNQAARKQQEHEEYWESIKPPVGTAAYKVWEQQKAGSFPVTAKKTRF